MGKLRGAKKLGVEKRTKLVGQLIKAHAELVKTQRLITGLDQVASTVNAGVIIIPGKSKNWIEEAQLEIASAADAIGQAQVKPRGHLPATEEKEEEPEGPSPVDTASQDAL